MVKNLLLLADVTGLLKVGSTKGDVISLPPMSIFLDWPLGYVVRVILGHFYGLYYVLILLVY